MALLASRLIVLQTTPPHPRSNERAITRALVPGGPEPSKKGLSNSIPLTVVFKEGVMGGSRIRRRGKGAGRLLLDESTTQWRRGGGILRVRERYALGASLRRVGQHGEEKHRGRPPQAAEP